MQTQFNRVAILIAVVALVAGAATAQTTTEVRQGKVLHVSNNQLLVELSDGTTQLFDVPADFKFDVDGQMLTVGQLKPGTILTQTVTTTTVPETVKTTEIRQARIVQRIGQTVIYRDERGRINKITGIPEGWIVFKDGQPVPIEALAGGDRVTAYVVHKETSLMTEEEMRVAGIVPEPAPKPAAAPAPAPKPAPAPAPAPAPMLPKTGSQLPLVGLAGLLALGLGLGLAVARRF
ncbi:MAG TPA: LPXTG cell wall anchor domain-containing protein [Candidatus Sulfomarinibacteraceae bacterium]|nr:LPXTG cell wall anchor domain-containing protein [Candidatus Sulfomarinibacteraceae bacterium]